MKKFIVFLLIVVMTFTLAACGNENGNKGGEKTSNVAVYTVDVEELDAVSYPDDYPLIASSKFKTDVEKVEQASMDGELGTYQDVVDIFGVDGVYFKNCDYDDDVAVYKYYAWYGDNGASILMTFKSKGDKLEYFAYTTGGTF